MYNYQPVENSEPKPEQNNPNNRKEVPPPNNNKDGKNLGRVGERTNKAWRNQTVFYDAIVDAILQAGYNEDEIGKKGGNNFCRILLEQRKAIIKNPGVYPISLQRNKYNAEIIKTYLFL